MYIWYFRQRLHKFDARIRWWKICQYSLNSYVVNSYVWDKFYYGKDPGVDKVHYWIILVRMVVNIGLISLGLSLEYDEDLRFVIFYVCIGVITVECIFAVLVFHVYFYEYKVCYLCRYWERDGDWEHGARSVGRQLKDSYKHVTSPASLVLEMRAGLFKKYKNRKIDGAYAQWGYKNFDELHKSFEHLQETTYEAGKNVYFLQSWFHMLRLEHDKDKAKSFKDTARKLLYLTPKNTKFLIDYADVQVHQEKIKNMPDIYWSLRLAVRQR
eukprot:UN01997